MFVLITKPGNEERESKAYKSFHSSENSIFFLKQQNFKGRRKTFPYLIFAIFFFYFVRSFFIPRHHQRKFTRSITKAPNNTMRTHKMCYMINHPSEQISWEIFSLRKAESRQVSQQKKATELPQPGGSTFA